MMSALVPLLMMTPLAPPTGPVWGQIDCLFESGKAGSLLFNESGISYTGPVPFVVVVEPAEVPQVTMVQFPLDGNLVREASFEDDGTIIIRGQMKHEILGKFVSIKPASARRSWMSFSVLRPEGEFADVGTCIAEIHGRLERPVGLTRIKTVRVD